MAQSAQAQSAQSAGPAGYGRLQTLQTAKKAAGPGRGGNSSLYTAAVDASNRPAIRSHWDSGFTPGSVPAPAAAAPTAEPAPPDAEAAAAAPAAGDEDGSGAMVDDGEGAPAAAPQPGPPLRSITIPKSNKRKGVPTPTLEDVRNAAGVGGAPAQPGASAPDAKHAPDGARDTSRDLRSRPRWVSDAEAFDAVRSSDRRRRKGRDLLSQYRPLLALRRNSLLHLRRGQPSSTGS